MMDELYFSKYFSVQAGLTGTWILKIFDCVNKQVNAAAYKFIHLKDFLNKLGTWNKNSIAQKYVRMMHDCVVAQSKVFAKE